MATYPLSIEGIGVISVTKPLKKIPKTMKDPLTGERVKVDRDSYKLIWATKYGTPKARKKLARELGILAKVV